MILYHGTTLKFGKFDLDKAQRRDSGNLGRGVYLTADPERAMLYAERNAERWGETPIVFRVQADLGRVAEFDIGELEAAGFTFPPEVWDHDRSERLREYYLARGYDTVRQMGTEVCVFDPARLRIVGEEPFVSERDRLIAHYEEKIGPWPGRARDAARNPPKARAAAKRVRETVGRGRDCYPAAEVVYHAGGGRRAGLTPVQQGRAWGAGVPRHVPALLRQDPQEQEPVGLARRLAVRSNPLDRHYVEGGCYHLALAMHELTGWPVVALVNDARGSVDHAGVVTPDGRFVDGGGAYSSTAEAADRWGLRAVPMTAHELASRTVVSPADAHDREAAEQLAREVSSNPPRARVAAKRVRKTVGRERDCYPAAEVVYHAGGGRRAGLTPVQQRHEGVSHWWVRGPGGEVLDPAAAQFRRPVPYERGRGRGFLTKKPSKRARQLARRSGVRLNPRWPMPDMDDYAGWPADAIEDAVLFLLRAKGAILSRDNLGAEARIRKAIHALDWANAMRSRWESGEFALEPPEAPPSAPGDPAWAPPPHVHTGALAALDVAAKAAAAGDLRRAGELVTVGVTLAAPAVNQVGGNAARLMGELLSGVDPRAVMAEVDLFMRALGVRQNPPWRPASHQEIARHLEESDQTGDEEFVQDMVDHVKKHDDWVLIDEVDPRRFAFNRCDDPDDLDWYRGDVSPVYVEEGFIQDGSHRASAAAAFGYTIPAYVRRADLRKSNP